MKKRPRYTLEQLLRTNSREITPEDLRVLGESGV